MNVASPTVVHVRPSTEQNGHLNMVSVTTTQDPV